MTINFRDDYRDLRAKVMTEKLEGNRLPKWVKIVELYPCVWCGAEAGEMCRQKFKDYPLPYSPPFHVVRLPSYEESWWNFK